VAKVDGVEQPSGAGASLGLNENVLRRVRASMYDVVNHERGTAFGSRIVADGMRMAGKTGTSQVRRITAEERARGVTSNADLPWERRDHACGSTSPPTRTRASPWPWSSSTAAEARPPRRPSAAT
jgi:penicillin-binding protein 2